jgi:thioester reductase-like protein
LLRRFRELAADHLEVLAGDIGEANLGLDTATWTRLTGTVDLVVHPAALVNHVLPYNQLFGPNVVGTAELIRLAITARIKPITYLSTIAVAMTVPPGEFEEDGDIRAVSPVRPIDDSYANGYANSKWAGEVLLREAHDLCGLPAAVFRSDMILAHTSYAGQLNVPDMFTRLLVSILATGIAPRSFYETDCAGHRPRAHYDGLPVDFIAKAVTTLGKNVTEGFRSFDVMNPYDDGISLDVFVDWLNLAGHRIERIDDYNDWVTRFETALTGLPEKQRQQSVNAICFGRPIHKAGRSILPRPRSWRVSTRRSLKSGQAATGDTTPAHRARTSVVCRFRSCARPRAKQRSTSPGGFVTLPPRRDCESARQRAAVDQRRTSRLGPSCTRWLRCGLGDHRTGSHGPRQPILAARARNHALSRRTKRRAPRASANADRVSGRILAWRQPSIARTMSDGDRSAAIRTAIDGGWTWKRTARPLATSVPNTRSPRATTTSTTKHTTMYRPGRQVRLMRRIVSIRHR